MYVGYVTFSIEAEAVILKIAPRQQLNFCPLWFYLFMVMRLIV